MTLSGYTYQCSAGETFDMVALAVYDDEKYAADLMTANPDLVHMMVFECGELLFLPVVEVPDTDDETGYAPSKAPWKEG